MPPDPSSEIAQIRQLLQYINDAWLHGPPAEIPSRLEPCFHDQIAMFGPGFQPLGGGQQAVAKSYQDFVQQAKILSCKLAEPTVHVTGDTAVATYAWDMTYELSGQSSTESGHDIFVFTRQSGHWLAVWRALLPAK